MIKKFEYWFKVPIFAKCIKASDEEEWRLKHDLEVGKLYEVEDIIMGMSYTDIIINGKEYNSVYLEFYYKDELIDIYKSLLFNPFMKCNVENFLKVKE